MIGNLFLEEQKNTDSTDAERSLLSRLCFNNIMLDKLEVAVINLNLMDLY